MARFTYAISRGVSVAAWAGALAASCAGQPAAPVLLQSSSHDVVQIELGHLPATGPDRAGVDAETAARLVTVCLRDLSRSGRAKGFDNRRRVPPRFVATKGETVCGVFEPAPQVFVLFKQTKAGVMTETLSTPLDLSNTDGTLIRFDWLQDGAPSGRY